jgi:AbiEi antitoxin C-terminal domain
MIREGTTRVIPRWAAGLVSRLTQVAPAVITTDSIGAHLVEVGCSVTATTAIARLTRQGWLRTIAVRGAWAFLPLGVDDLADPYLDLRGWQLAHPDAKFCLAGDSAAWHLGYVDRSPERPSVWLADGTVLPKGLRGKVVSVKTRFPEHVDWRKLGPTSQLLRRRNLDLLTWSTKLPAFGPEALLVQISSRPASFTGWVDLAARLDALAGDVDIERLSDLLSAATDATRQRAVYLLRLGHRTDAAKLLPSELQPVQFGKDGPATWDAATAISDHLVAPLLRANEKA